MERTATAAEVQSALGVTDRTLRNWQKRGLPRSPAGPGVTGRPGWRFNIDEVRAWVAERGYGSVIGCAPEERGPPDEMIPVGPGNAPGRAPHPWTKPEKLAVPPTQDQILRQELLEQRAAKERLLVEQRQLELERARGHLVPLEEVRAFWESQVALVRAHFQALPGRLAPRLLDLSYEEIYSQVERELESVLLAFASGELPGREGA